MTSRSTAGRCGRCGYELDDATSMDGSIQKPNAGDLGLCLVCAAPLGYTQTGQPQWLTYEELTAAVTGPNGENMQGRLMTAMFLILTLRPSRVEKRDPGVE
jgi:hypothetical protein